MYNTNGNIIGGSYAITEQGDLGLGLTPIDEGFVNTEDNDEKKRKPASDTKKEKQSK